MIEILIVAPTRYYRDCLAGCLRHVGGFDVVATGAAPRDVEEELSALGRGVVLVDVADSPADSGAVVSLAARSPGLRVVVLGVSEDESEILAYAEMGTAGYVTRNHSIDELVRTIESAAAGELRCSPRIAAALSRRVAQLAAEVEQDGKPELLSAREAEITELLAQGLSNQEIAHRLCIALATVKNHVHNILEKLHVRGRADAGAWARCVLDRSALLRLPATGSARENGERAAPHRG